MTTKTKGTHTPGPWEFGEEREGTLEIQTSQGAIAEVWGMPEAEADARLIAASPDLLEACKFLKKFYKPTYSGLDPIVKAEWEKLEETISRAEGRE